MEFEVLSHTMAEVPEHILAALHLKTRLAEHRRFTD
jgi:hypothetical protein